MEYKITNIWDDSINNVHHITVEYNGNSYSVIFGRYINGGFFSIPNWGVGGELGQFRDTSQQPQKTVIGGIFVIYYNG